MVVDQLVLKENLRSRLSESINTAIVLANGRVIIENTKGERTAYSIHSSCPICGFSFPDLEPRIFSFNNPRGACEACHGLGTLDLVEEEQYSYEEGGKIHGKVSYRYKNEKKISDDEEEAEELDLSTCPECHGTRLKPEALSVLVQGKNIAEVAELSCIEL